VLFQYPLERCPVIHGGWQTRKTRGGRLISSIATRNSYQNTDYYILRACSERSSQANSMATDSNPSTNIRSPRAATLKTHQVLFAVPIISHQGCVYSRRLASVRLLASIFHTGLRNFESSRTDISSYYVHSANNLRHQTIAAAGPPRLGSRMVCPNEGASPTLREEFS